MRKFGKLALGAAAMLALAVLVQPAFASCGGAPIITTYNLTTGDLSPMWSESSSVWRTYFNGSSNPPCYTYGCYGAPLGADLQGFFWRAGTGNPAVGPGDDNGGFPVSSWVDQPAAGTYFNAARIQSNWNIGGIDGCLDGGDGGFGPEDCMCLLLTDSDGSTGYFALMSNQPNGIGNTEFWLPGSAPLVLKPLPKVQITGSSRLQPSLDVQLSVRADAPTEGVYAQGGCDCGPISYKVYQQVLPRGSAAPDSRDLSGWTEVVGSTPIGTGTDYTSGCGSAENDVWLTAGYEFESGFTSTLVSGNSTKVECGPNLATPEELNRRPVRLPSRTPRKGGSRR